MKYFSASKVALLLAIACQVQGSAMVAQTPIPEESLSYNKMPLLADDLEAAIPNLHLNRCINRHFGRGMNGSSMLGTVYEAPMSKVIDAFIDCPDVMSLV